MSRAIGVSLFALLVASSAQAQQIGDVFYIALENHNFTQPSSVTDPAPIFGNSAAPFINSLVTPGNANAAQTSFAGNYQNVAPGLHPSEPNYVWQESGTHGPLNDNDPFPANVVNAPNLSALLAAKGQTWRSYQEDTDLVNTNGNNINGDHGAGVAPTNTVAQKSQYEVPLTSFSGTSASYTNPYNGSNQYNYAAKHNPEVFFNATNGGNDPTSANSQAQNYAPLQQLSDGPEQQQRRALQLDHAGSVQRHAFGVEHGLHLQRRHLRRGNDAEQIALGDNFLSMMVPEIEASQAYKNNGMIVIWNDETEGDEDVGSTAGFDGTEIIISPLAKGNAYTNNILYTHSSDLVTLQNIFGVAGGALAAILGGVGLTQPT